MKQGLTSIPGTSRSQARHDEATDRVTAPFSNLVSTPAAGSGPSAPRAQARPSLARSTPSYPAAAGSSRTSVASPSLVVLISRNAGVRGRAVWEWKEERGTPASSSYVSCPRLVWLERAFRTLRRVTRLPTRRLEPSPRSHRCAPYRTGPVRTAPIAQSIDRNYHSVLPYPAHFPSCRLLPNVRGERLVSPDRAVSREDFTSQVLARMARAPKTSHRRTGVCERQPQSSPGRGAKFAIRHSDPVCAI